MSKDYYKILGVDKNASADEVKKAFRKKAHEFHPDKKGGDEAKFKEINEAYQVLGDQKKRAQYDQFGSAFEHAQTGGGFQGFEGFRDFSGFTNGFNIDADDLGDIFGGIGDIFGFGAGKRAERGGDIQVLLNIKFSEAFFGAEKEISLRKTIKCGRCGGRGGEPGAEIKTCGNCGGTGRVLRAQRTVLGNIQTRTVCDVCGGEGKIYSQKCSKCRGSGIVEDAVKIKVKIPAGIDDGETIRLAGYGEAGSQGAPAGDLYLKIKVSPDAKFKREGDDILSDVFISFAQAALGDKINVETMEGSVKLKISAGTQPGTVFRLRDKGFPILRGRGRGDQLVKVKIKVPTGLTKKQKGLLEESGL